MYICMYTTCMAHALRVQKVTDSSEKASQVVVRHQVGAGNKTWSSTRVTNALNRCIVSSAPSFASRVLRLAPSIN